MHPLRGRCIAFRLARVNATAHLVGEFAPTRQPPVKGFVHRGVTDDLNLACFGIDLDFTDLRAVGKARDGERLVGDAGEGPLQIPWQVLARDGGRGNLKDADFAIGAGDPISDALELDVDFASLEQEAGDLASLVYDVVGRLTDY